MENKTLIIHPERCTGCKDCETACAVKNNGFANPHLSNIRIITDNSDDGFFLPTVCQQCEDPPCLAACPKDAIYRDEDLNRVLINQDKCVGCTMCVSACPFGAIRFDMERGKSFKCDLCDGKPECVKACKAKALEYSEPESMQLPQMSQSAFKMAGIMRRMII
ncbi:MAG: 4Fe-4S dicluster domain-containing protein [Deltaproteobacteria bacterium]|nr:4Fe-4S dicluster domain-containing protein [Deltaproteobacteria bacterium]